MPSYPAPPRGADGQAPDSEQPHGKTTGIFGLFFREAGLFWEQAWRWSEEQAREDRLLAAEQEKRRLNDVQIRQAEARLLEQIRLAKEAGLDVDTLLRASRSELR